MKTQWAIKNTVHVGDVAQFQKCFAWAVVVVMVWCSECLSQPMLSVPITTKVVSSKSLSWQGVLDTALCDKGCQ